VIFLKDLKDPNSVDNETKHRLKQQDQFVTMTGHGLGWASRNRRSAAVTAGLLLLLILVLVGGYTLYQHRSQSAQTAFGTAMETYQTPLVKPGQPPPPGMKTFQTAEERAKAANAQFLDVANRYGMTQTGKLARYFAGLTYLEEGQNGSAETTLKEVSGSWNGDLAALGKLALAQLYEQTGRNDQAVDLLEQLGKAKDMTVPAGEAQLQLGELYSAEGNTTKARDIFAKLKDTDKDSKGNPGPASSIASEKLNPKPAGASGLPPQ